MNRGFYIRWVVTLAIGAIIVGLAAERYSREVKTVGPDQVMSFTSSGPVRVLGMVEAGSLLKTNPFSEATFFLIRGESRIPVIYKGEEPDNLRDLKTIVVVGHWEAENGHFISEKIDLVPNFGFVLAAYLALIPVVLFLFLMEQKVMMLYNEIKQSSVYEAEVEAIDKR